jgi:hypothetical protein
MIDFTPDIFIRLINALKIQEYQFQRVADFILTPKNKSIILRHDVDSLPLNSLLFARIEHSMGAIGTYYFRIDSKSYDSTIIKNIDLLGHEVGYHYENLTTCKGDKEKAFLDFQCNLAKLRTLVPISTICMHGSPRSPWDSRDLWATYDYRKEDIIAEPYLDFDFNQVFYLTDTGRKWDGWKTSVRDKIEQQKDWIRQGLVFRTTKDLINAVEEGRLPAKTMITIHPQRWHSKPWPWFKELIQQNIKNTVKRFLIKFRTKQL